MENLEWPHLEVFKAACRIEPASRQDDDAAAHSSELVRIFKSLKNYIFISLTDQDASDTAIEILETFTWKFQDIRDQCLDESLEIMIKTLRLLYEPDIEDECKENVQKYLENLYFSEEDSSKQKDFVYNAIKNFAEMNQQAYQSSNLIELMNSIVQDRRGEIFAQADTPSEVRSRGYDRDAVISK
jgi:hypothetical protein|tara:strand:+ start:1013 stop:1567 length:555 start_codon:yes stop_codon:yes gene_type:complete